MPVALAAAALWPPLSVVAHRLHARAGRRHGRIVRVERRVLPVVVHVRRAVPRTSCARAVQYPRRLHVGGAGRLRRRAHPGAMAAAAHGADRRDCSASSCSKRCRGCRSSASGRSRRPSTRASPASRPRCSPNSRCRPRRSAYFFDTRYLYFSTFHWHPIVNGNSGYFPKSYEELTERERDFPSDSAVEYLRTRGVDYVAVHGAFIDPEKFRADRDGARRAAGHAAGGGRALGRQRVEAVSASTGNL